MHRIHLTLTNVYWYGELVRILSTCYLRSSMYFVLINLWGAISMKSELQNIQFGSSKKNLFGEFLIIIWFIINITNNTTSPPTYAVSVTITLNDCIISMAQLTYNDIIYFNICIHNYMLCILYIYSLFHISLVSLYNWK